MEAFPCCIVCTAREVVSYRLYSPLTNVALTAMISPLSPAENPLTEPIVVQMILFRSLNYYVSKFIASGAARASVPQNS